MRIMILGIDGYIGFPLALHLLQRGHEVIGLDCFARRDRVEGVGSNSLTPISSVFERERILKNYDNFKDRIINVQLGVRESFIINAILREHKPDAIVHLAEQPSAPWSMIDAEHASMTQQDNILGTLHLLWAIKHNCPNTHLLKLGTMGEYGTPNCDIPEGKIPNVPCLWIPPNGDPEFPSLKLKGKCPMSGLLFPRTPGSFYHLTKVHDTFNIEFACRNWGLRSTDIMQGVVFGLGPFTDEKLLTRFDYDECFGTAINRFCAQALINHPLTVYGLGQQTRGFLTLSDSIQCLTIALENPPAEGEYRTLNQFENIYSIYELAVMVAKGAEENDLHIGIKNIPNPRKEAEQHYYNPAHQKLFDLGYVPTTNIQEEITKLINLLLPYKDRVIPEVIMPKINWR